MFIVGSSPPTIATKIKLAKLEMGVAPFYKMGRQLILKFIMIPINPGNYPTPANQHAEYRY